MAIRDPHRYVNELDDEAVQRLIHRLESRAKDRVFTDLIGKYSSRLMLANPGSVLEVGCGTGAMIRAFAGSDGFDGIALGVDQSIPFIEAARSFAERENLGYRMQFQVGDAHGLDLPSSSFDVVIANTLISHVADPLCVLEEMARVVSSDGIIAIFDGDYASMTYAFPDHEFGQAMDRALVTASFNNPGIMRDIPRMLDTLGLKLFSAWGDAVAEIGRGSYFSSFAETYAPYVANSGLLSDTEVDNWLSVQREAMESKTFFASCNYYTYLLRHA